MTDAIDKTTETLKEKYGLDDKETCGLCDQEYHRSDKAPAFHDMPYCESCLRTYYDNHYKANKKAQGFQIFMGFYIFILFVNFVRSTNASFGMILKFDFISFFIGLVSMGVIALFAYGFYRLMKFKVDVITGLILGVPAVGIIFAPIAIFIRGPWWAIFFWIIMVGLWIYFLTDTKLRSLFNDPLIADIQIALIKNKFYEKAGVNKG
jgi:hypothetical protein